MEISPEIVLVYLVLVLAHLYFKLKAERLDASPGQPPKVQYQRARLIMNLMLFPSKPAVVGKFRLVSRGKLPSEMRMWARGQKRLIYHRVRILDCRSLAILLLSVQQQSWNLSCKIRFLQSHLITFISCLTL